MQQDSGAAVIPNMDDEALVETVAGDYVRMFGPHATARLREWQEIAAAQGDVLSADASRAAPRARPGSGSRSRPETATNPAAAPKRARRHIGKGTSGGGYKK